MKNYFKPVLALTIIALIPTISLSMEQGDIPPTEQETYPPIGDYPLMTEQIYKLGLETDPYNPTFLTNKELTFLYAVEDNNEEVIDQLLDNQKFIQKADARVFQAAANIATSPNLKNKILYKIWFKQIAEKQHEIGEFNR